MKWVAADETVSELLSFFCSRQMFSLFGCLGIDLKKASKAFANRFSCGSSVTGEDEIVIQGDVTDDLWDFIPEKWPDVSCL